MEGDAKTCFDVLKSRLSNVEWSISTLLSNVLELSGRFVSCDFSLGWNHGRDANCIAQALQVCFCLNKWFIQCNKLF